jgi:hypothetical protein
MCIEDNFMNSEGECHPCDTEAGKCKEGTTTLNITVRRGFYRFSEDSTKIYACLAQVSRCQVGTLCTIVGISVLRSLLDCRLVSTGLWTADYSLSSHHHVPPPQTLVLILLVDHHQLRRQ